MPHWADGTALRSDDEDLKRWGRETNRGYRKVYEAALAGERMDVETLDWATAAAYWQGRRDRQRQLVDTVWQWLRRRRKR